METSPGNYIYCSLRAYNRVENAFKLVRCERGPLARKECVRGPLAFVETDHLFIVFLRFYIIFHLFIIVHLFVARLFLHRLGATLLLQLLTPPPL